MPTPGRILVIDDDPAVVALLVARLEGARYTVTSAEDAMAAIHQATALRPWLIISDIQMPIWGGGADVYAQIRNHPVLRQTPLIFITGLSANEALAQIPWIGRDPKVRALAKPLQMPMLERAIQELTGEYRPLSKQDSAGSF